MGSVDAFAASQGSQHCSGHSCFSGRWSETDKGRIQTPASLEVSKICYTAVRWIRYFLRELEYFRGTICIWTGIQILPNTTSEGPSVYGEIGLVDFWWMPDWIHPQQWILTVDRKVRQWAASFLILTLSFHFCILKIRFSNFVSGAIHSLHWWRCGLLSSVYPNSGSPLELSCIEMYLTFEIWKFNQAMFSQPLSSL